MAEREIVRWFRLRTEYGNCVWCVDRDGLLHVNTQHGSKCTQLGGSEPTFLDRLLTKEITGLRTDLSRPTPNKGNHRAS